MLRLHIAADTVAMGADGVDQFFGAADLPQKLRGLDAVFLRPFFKVRIVEQSRAKQAAREGT